MSPNQRILAAIDQASAGLVGRRPVIELLALAAVAGQHVLVLGPPGTAKSALVRRFSKAFSARRFEYLLGRFTEPSELFGPVDLVALREGRVLTRTEGMLPEAEFAFLDEVFLGSTAILNTLLGLLNERRFRRGHDVVDVPLRLCVGASNERPGGPELAAFADRFALTAYVEPIDNHRLEELLTSAQALRPVEGVASIEDLDAVAALTREVDVSAVRGAYAEAVRTLRREGLVLSDRRVVQGQQLIAAAAALAGRQQATRADLWPLVNVVPMADGQERARVALRELLDASDSPVLASAAEAASAGRAVRNRRLTAEATDVLGQDRTDSWRREAEAVLREIDAGLAPADRTEALEALRSQLVEALT